MLKSLRYILLPFSIIYSAVISLRNKLFDKNILRSATFDIPIICVGNLAAGGTGKTPMVEYLIGMMNEKYKVSILSRGYKRKTKGFLVANEESTAAEIGDEPMQIHKKFPHISVAVAEERVMGIPQLLLEKPATQVIILDDAFQHREVKAGLNILLTDCNHLYSKDFLLPAGNLRDVKSSSKRADIIVVTKCKSDLDEAEKKSIINELKPSSKQKIFFTKIEYGKPYHLFSDEIFCSEKDSEVLFVCGIANPTTIKKTLKDKFLSFQMLEYKDHYNYNLDDVKKIIDAFSKIRSSKKIILTTEKDAVRFLKFEKDLSALPIYVLPMSHAFLFDDKSKFEKVIFDFISEFKSP
jgi:tetraacyldisaccharide 4'-kinase